MDIYHGFFSLKDGQSDIALAENLTHYLGFLQDRGKIASWRLMRRKLGLGPKSLGEFHLMIEVENLAQLDDAFSLVATRAGEVEGRHFNVNRMISEITFALYRDFPDS
ncbi:MAG: hypothetical protein K8F25_13630, partial [Fimbriimonadaceae bacterium]|nr:hypothetical protein [Alphaproteobacteria bacterium]